MQSTPTIKCPRCGGTGGIPDPKGIGEKLKAKRVRAGLSLNEMGSRLGISGSYVSHLEHGRKPWTKCRIAAFLKNIKKA